MVPKYYLGDSLEHFVFYVWSVFWLHVFSDCEQRFPKERSCPGLDAGAQARGSVGDPGWAPVCSTAGFLRLWTTHLTWEQAPEGWLPAWILC